MLQVQYAINFSYMRYITFTRSIMKYTCESKTENGVGEFLVNNPTFTWALNKCRRIFSVQSYAIWQAPLYFSLSGKIQVLSVLTQCFKFTTRQFPKKLI